MNEIEITSNISITKEALEEAKEICLEMLGLAAERHAKEYCPVVTGRLRNSITHAPNADESYVAVGTNVEYASYVELGSSRRKNPHPYIRPGIENHLDEYKKIIENVLKN